ncbi:hypothetical protein ACLBSO_16515, partial [Klebsiella pneumoniae]
MQFDWSAIWPAIPILLEGAKMTLWISVLGLAGGLIIGLVAGFARCFEYQNEDYWRNFGKNKSSF